MSSFRWKNFGQHLLTLVLPKWTNPSKSGWKIGRNHGMTQWPGGFFVLRYQDPIFGPVGVQDVYSTLPKPFVHIWNTHGEIKIWTLLKITILSYFGGKFEQLYKKSILSWDLTTRYNACRRNTELILVIWDVLVWIWWFVARLTRCEHFRPFPANWKWILQVILK